MQYINYYPGCIQITNPKNIISDNPENKFRLAVKKIKP